MLPQYSLSHRYISTAALPSSVNQAPRIASPSVPWAGAFEVLSKIAQTKKSSNRFPIKLLLSSISVKVPDQPCGVPPKDTALAHLSQEPA